MVTRMRDKLGRLQNKWYQTLHEWRLGWLGRNKDNEYRDYLKIQYKRSYTKRNVHLQSTLLIDRLAEYLTPHSVVLCIGSRNIEELDHIKSKGVEKVIGIDIFSENPAILVMDMHHLKFPDASFDVVYSSHSLEHAYDAQKVIQEIIRVARPHAVVAIEVPIRYETRDADRLDFESAENLISQFQPYVSKILASEDHPRLSAFNRYGNDIARVIFTISKP